MENLMENHKNASPNCIMDPNKKHQRTTQQQLQFYLQFCKDHPELQAGKNADLHLLRSLWRELADGLNMMRGPTRNPKKWKESLCQWKSQIRCRARKEMVQQPTKRRVPYVKETELTKVRQQTIATLAELEAAGVPNIGALGFPQVKNTAEPSSECVDEPANVRRLSVELESPSDNVESPADISESPSGTDLGAIASSASGKECVTLQLIYDKMQQASERREEKQRQRMELAERALEQQREATDAFRYMGDAIFALVRTIADTHTQK